MTMPFGGGFELGEDGVDVVVPLGNGLSIDTDGEIGVDVGGFRVEADGDISFGGFNLTGD